MKALWIRVSGVALAVAFAGGGCEEAPGEAPTLPDPVPIEGMPGTVIAAEPARGEPPSEARHPPDRAVFARWRAARALQDGGAQRALDGRNHGGARGVGPR